MNSLQEPKLDLPSQVPVMFLPSCVLLPHVLLPLFIFEPRYRAMLAHCLEQSRIFCIALLRPGVTEVTGGDDYFPIAGVGLVRACVGHEDGTSHLVLQGLERVRLRGFVQVEPFRIAEVRELDSIPSEDPELPALSEKLRAQAAALMPGAAAEAKKLTEQLAVISDLGMLTDVIAHTFLRGAEKQQEILEELEVGKRMRRLAQMLTEE